jgi:hypothetical protein
VRGIRCGENRGKDSVCVAQHVIVPETEDTVPNQGQSPRPRRIGCAIDDVLGAIKLHDESTLKTHEIRDVTANRMLPSELETSKSAIPEMLPDQPLCVCSQSSEIAGDAGTALLYHPHPTPLPFKGEGNTRTHIDE